MTIIFLACILSCGEVLAQDRGFLGNRRSKPERPLAPQLKAAKTSPKSKAHKKTYRTRGTQPAKLAKKKRDSRRLFFPSDRPSRTSRYANVGYGGPAPRKGVRDDRQFIPASPKGETDNKKFGKFASPGPSPRIKVRDNRKYYQATPVTKADKKNFGRFASSGPAAKKGARDTRKFYPTTPDTKVDRKNFGRFASSGPVSRKGTRDNRKYYPTTPDTKADRRNFGRFASSGPVLRKGVRDTRKYFSTTPTFKADRKNFGLFAQKGPRRGKPIKDQRPGKIAGLYGRSPAPDGAFFNTPLPAKGTGKIAGLSANYQGNFTRRPTAKYSKEIANYTGHRGDLLRYRIRMTRQPATYAGGERTFMRSTGINISGLLTFKRANKVYPRKDIAKYSGNSYRKTPNYKKTGAYSQGDVLVKNRYYRGWFKSTKESVSYYFYNLNLGFKSFSNKQIVKGAHPTAIYARNSNRHKSVEKKEVNRKRNLWINRLFVFRGKDQPDDFKKQVRKPKYDRKEHKIWND